MYQLFSEFKIIRISISGETLYQIFLHEVYGYRNGFQDGVTAKVEDYNFKQNKFNLWSLYYVHFRTKTDGKGMNSLILAIRD